MDTQAKLQSPLRVEELQCAECLFALVQAGRDLIANNPAAIYPEGGLSPEQVLAQLDDCERWVKSKLNEL